MFFNLLRAADKVGKVQILKIPVTKVGCILISVGTYIKHYSLQLTRSDPVQHFALIKRFIECERTRKRLVYSSVYRNRFVLENKKY